MKRRLANESIPDGNKIRPRNHVLLSDKSISDVVEALIGVHLANAGQTGAAQFISFIGLGFTPKEDIKKVTSYDDDERNVNPDWFKLAHQAMPKTSLWQIREAGAFGDNMDCQEIKEKLDHFMKKVNLQILEETLDYEFEDKSFLLQALTHASYAYNTITYSCERLEFLGDAVLDYLITSHLVTKDNKLTPGRITDLRSALVNNNNLADICVRNGLQKHLLQLSPELFKRIDFYVTDHDQALENEIEGKAQYGQRTLKEIENTFNSIFICAW